MPISRGDRFKLLCHIGKIEKFQTFKIAYWKQQDPDPRTEEKALRKAFLRWARTGSIRSRQREYFLAALKVSGWSSLPDPDELLEREDSVPEFLDICKLSFEEVEHLLSPESKNEWSAGHHNLYFMKALDEQSKVKRAKAFVPNLIGTYRLYRRHSVLPGLLRESFIIDKVKDGHCEGLYSQYVRAQPPNIIPFNAFICEFYVMAFGAHQAVGTRTEIITVSVLIENAFSNNEPIPCDQHNKYFIGLLTGIYDYGNVLLAERVLIEKIDPKVQLKRVEGAEGETELRMPKSTPVHIHQGSDRELKGEYNRVIDVIDNSLDGQTLTARPDRVEMVRD
jgi:hypothetical protein